VCSGSPSVNFAVRVVEQHETHTAKQHAAGSHCNDDLNRVHQTYEVLAAGADHAGIAGADDSGGSPGEWEDQAERKRVDADDSERATDDFDRPAVDRLTPVESEGVDDDDSKTA
jgi:hypothetical protein